ncbi:DUF4381 domain-containing protein [Marinimicrobium sp. LS-A18]|uniref:DUF4381 domain-containing protein n=1 Tax=Marinimicrobium sp. LS-A18 TaxID=1381596 RepID=UPI00046432AE|nr:DUF4381 domain-containing protein [Marinimicrobium sp. LS-A18]
MNPQDPLAQLKDIHLPEPIGWWPLAWGWWLLIALLLIVLGALLWQGYRRQRRQRYRREAMALLDHAYRDYLRSDPGPATHRHYLQQVSQLLRRTALSALPEAREAELAALKGPQWLRFLDASAGLEPAFTEGPGHILADGPYQPDPKVDVEALHQLAAQWIRRHRLSERHLQQWLAEVHHA